MTVLRKPTATHALSKQSPVPLYYQLKTLLLEKIRTGELRANDRLPAEDVLASQYGVSKATVRQALGELSNAGLLRRVQGLGTFVAEPRLELGPRELTSFTEEMIARGRRPSSRILAQQVLPADGVVAEKLDVDPSAEVLYLRRLRLANDEVLGVQEAHVPLYLARGLESEDLSNASLYEVLSKKYLLVPARARESHYAVPVQRAEAEALGVAEGSAGLAGERITYLASGRPLEYVRSLMRGDRYEIVLELVSRPAVR